MGQTDAQPKHMRGLSSRVVSASDCGVTGPRFESHRGRLFIATAAATYSLGHRLRTFTALPRSSQLPPPWDGKMSTRLWAD